MIDQILNKKITVEQVKRVRDWYAELDIIFAQLTKDSSDEARLLRNNGSPFP